MKCVVLVQARSGSDRLPGKALLHFRGMPLVVLAARRAARGGLPVIVATSDEPSDDALAGVIEAAGLKCSRGPLNDVLRRFVGALAAYGDDTLVVRLTADNVVPDGDLISDVVAWFRERELGYVTTTAPGSGLPYGASVEVMRLRHLREADREATASYEREHVTPWLIERYGRNVYARHAELGLDDFRLTVDSLDDFLSLDRVFPTGRDPLAVSWRELATRSSLGLYQPRQGRFVRQMVLGTAQLGASYGILNAEKLEESERVVMIKTALGAGVGALDTAAAYGSSEALIGNVLATGWRGRSEVVTKLSPLQDVEAGAAEATVEAVVESRVLESCLALRTPVLETLLLHRCRHLDDWNGAVWRKLLQMKRDGRITTLGVSVQSPEELARAVQESEVEHIQLPFNVLDHRWDTSISAIQQAKAARRIQVHARSALLQGLLTTADPRHWQRANVDDPTAVLAWLRGQTEESGRTSVAEMCIAFVRAQGWIDGVVVGADNMAQLEANIALFQMPAMHSVDCRRVIETRPRTGVETLDPSMWRTG